MPRPSIDRPELHPFQRQLAEIIDAALKDGRCADPKKAKQRKNGRWTSRSFADAFQFAETSVGNWRNRDKLSPPDNIEPLLDAFYGEDPEYTAERDRMLNLWRLSRDHIQPDTIGVSETEVIANPNIQGVVELVSLDGPLVKLGNDGRPSLFVNLTITPDVERSYRTYPVTIGLSKALLCIESDNWRPAFQTRISDEAQGNINFEPVAAGSMIVGPLDPDLGMIKGQPAGANRISAVERKGSGDGPITVSVRAPAGAFKVRGRGKVTPNQDAVTQALMNEQLKDRDSSGRPILASLTIDLKEH